MALHEKVLSAASGDSRQSAGETCRPAREAMDKQVALALAGFGVEAEPARRYDLALKRSFISGRKQSLEIFADTDPGTPIIVAELGLEAAQCGSNKNGAPLQH